MAIAKKHMVELLRRMHDARNFDMKANQLVRRDVVQGMTHFSVGEEAANIAAIIQMEDADIMFASHRGHAACIGKGMDLNAMMAELAGKITGVARGKGGSMHLADVAHGNFGTNGIVGGSFALGTGTAFAQKREGEKHYTVVVTGDGSTNEGSFHESVNMAATWNLPIIFYVINNKYGISMDIAKATNTEHLYTRAEAYGIKGIYVEDGNDAAAVYDSFAAAVKHVKAGKGPVLMEVKSYRWFGHSTADAGAYRTKEEVADWKAKDPLPRYEAYLIEKGVLSREEIDQIAAESKKRVDEAAEFARSSPEPTLDVAYEDVFAE